MSIPTYYTICQFTEAMPASIKNTIFGSNSYTLPNLAYVMCTYSDLQTLSTTFTYLNYQGLNLLNPNSWQSAGLLKTMGNTAIYTSKLAPLTDFQTMNGAILALLGVWYTYSFTDGNGTVQQMQAGFLNNSDATTINNSLSNFNYSVSASSNLPQAGITYSTTQNLNSLIVSLQSWAEGNS